MAINIHLPLLLLLSVVGTSMAATDCFTQVGDTHTVPANSAQRVSVGIDCPTSERNITCPLQVGGFLKDSPTLNITTDSKDKVFHAVRQATNGTFDDPVIGSVSNFTYPVEPGAMGFYAFTLTLVCYEGTLGDCIGGDVEPGTPVEACEPRTLDGSSTTGFSSFIGDGNFVATAGISNMTTNPAAMEPQASSASSMRSVAPISILGSAIGVAILWHLC